MARDRTTFVLSNPRGGLVNLPGDVFPESECSSEPTRVADLRTDAHPDHNGFRRLPVDVAEAALPPFRELHRD